MAQLIANSILFASVYIIVGLGFTLIYQVTRFFQTAKGDIIKL